MNPARPCIAVCLTLLCAITPALAGQNPVNPEVAPQSTAAAQTDAEALLKGFDDPPNSARPRVWWHWMNGNITEQGIKLDLDWMHRVGLGGVTIFEGAMHTPQVVPQRLIYMTPEWRQAFTYAVTTARTSWAWKWPSPARRMERDRGPVGSCRAGHEEDGVERHAN